VKTLSIAALAVCLFCTNAVSAPESIQSPKELVVAFYRLALMDFRPKEAFVQYAAPDFVEHSADSAGGTTQATVDFLSGLIKKSPQAKWEIVRVIAEDDMVFLHVRFTPNKGATPVSVGEIFRVRNGKVAEHWDIIQHAPEHPVNPNSVF
jgi:predicted SnoaL-like aldol condensation-catalyzing enzyme